MSPPPPGRLIVPIRLPRLNSLSESALDEPDTRTPPNHLSGFDCDDYFSDGYAQRGHYDAPAHLWVVKPFHELDAGMRLGFLAVGDAGVDGIRFGYRFGMHGLWAYYPIGHEFVWKAATLAELVEGWCSGTITV